MKRLILLFLLISTSLFGARKTLVITSIINGGKTAENVTINSGYTGTDGTITLSAAVPSTIKVGDTITDSATNTYLITAISGSDLTAQDFDTTTDPATGAATIQEAYQSITAWEADLDVTTLYASGDTAQGEMYKSGGAFDEAVTMNGGDTIGLGEVILTVPVSERHDGTAGTGARIVASVGRNWQISTPSGQNYILEWFEFDQNSQGENSLYSNGIFTNVPTFRNLIVHDQSGGNAFYGFIRAATRDPLIMNSIFYNNTRSTTLDVIGLDIDGDMANAGCYNNTVYNVKNTSSGNVYGIRVNTNSANHNDKNNISMGTTSSSGTALDFSYAGTNINALNNMSEDSTADDAGGTGHLLGKTVSAQFVSTVSGSEDLHLKNTSADAFEAGTDLGTTPSGVQFDIDNYDRDTGATTWSIGAHDGNNLRGGAANPTLKRRRKVIR